jgi:SAM-dependent methyltransferase
MDRPEYALGVFWQHFDRVQFPRKKQGFTMLELGPGDSLFSALIARAFGASEVYLVDEGPYARRDLGPYVRMTAFLKEKGFCTASFENCRPLENMLAACSAHYLTGGLESLREIPHSSVDFVWSHGVLQSVRRTEFLPTLRELRRIQRPDGVGSHVVELKDCLSGALNNLRFRERIWESNLIARSGFYTNRIRYTQMLKLFREAGFDAEVLETQSWEKLPTPRHKLAPPFRDLPEEELRMSAFEVLLR